MKILVFLQGTTIMHQGGLGRPRGARVRQVIDGEPSVLDFSSYVPIGRAAAKLRAWQNEGADIAYVTSRRTPEDVTEDEALLRKHGFPPGPVLSRGHGCTYGDLVEGAAPDVLVEDDCESIGGAPQTASAQLSPAVRARIRVVCVREFGGIDDLPDRLNAPEEP
jgi:hypothetical protein